MLALAVKFITIGRLRVWLMTDHWFPFALPSPSWTTAFKGTIIVVVCHISKRSYVWSQPSCTLHKKYNSPFLYGPTLLPFSRVLLCCKMGLEISVGALLLASWFAMALTGALLLQTYIYFRYKPKDDRPAFGILVWFVLLNLRYSCELTSSWRRCYYGDLIIFFS